MGGCSSLVCLDLQWEQNTNTTAPEITEYRVGVLRNTHSGVDYSTRGLFWVCGGPLSSVGNETEAQKSEQSSILFIGPHPVTESIGSKLSL